MLIGVSLIVLFSVASIADNRILVKSREFIDVQSAGFYFSLGDYLYKQGKAVEAVKAYEKGLRLNPDNGGALNNIGVYYLSKNDVEHAEEHFARAASVNPDSE